MKLYFFIAKRFLLSKKSHSIVNIISWISVGGITVGVAALIIILSVFNGLEELVLSLYETFDSDIKITAVNGKYFELSSEQIEKIKKIEQIKSIEEILEENAGLEYDNHQYIATLKGVSNNYLNLKGIKLIDGTNILTYNNLDFSVIGAGIASFLEIKLADRTKFISVYIPKRNKNLSLLTEETFNKGFLLPAGIFSIEQQIDEKYIYVPLRFMRKILDLPKKVTSIEIILENPENSEFVKKEISKIIDKNLKIQTKDEQHEFINKIMKNEKLAIFLILTFVLILATFNIIGSLTILILEKKNEIVILKALGCDNKKIGMIFFTEGMLISLIGITTGIFLGIIVCFLQMYFGLVKLGEGNMIIEAYPVKLLFTDFIYVTLSILTISCISNLLPVKWLSKKYLKTNESLNY